jgi:UDP-N-acetylmuramate--alanine ligase
MGVDFNNIKRVYFLGIGGIGMSALARYFKATGKDVAGFDRTQTPLTRELINSGISIHYSDEKGLIPADYLNKEDTLVVVTPAIPGDHKELAYFKNNNFRLFKRSEILGYIAGQKYNIAVSGTHGKTTVSTMIAHIMNQSAYGCSAFLGGISKNFKSNLIYNEKSNYIITEADEFDRSFLRLYPQLTVITAMDADHLDIYGSRDELVRTFSQFANQTRKGGKILVKKGLKPDLKYDYENYTYTLTEKADFYATNITLNRGIYSFEVITPTSIIKNMSLNHPGIVNVENAVAATAVSCLIGIDEENIRSALRTFNGISRRFDIILQTEELTYIDDYAHHPKELSAVINSVKKLYPGKKVTGIFQPHLYSRTRDFAGEFAESLDTLDDLILLDIYPARELPVKNITSKIIYDKVKLADKMLCSKNELTGILKDRKIEVLLTMGAGDIDQLVKPIKTMLSEKLKKGGK